MSLGRKINQNKFRNERQKSIINLVYSYNWLMEHTKSFLDSENITPQHFNILRILRGAYPKPLSTLQIRERMLDKMSDTSRIVDRLIVKALATKRVCPSDRRMVDVIITEKGRKLLEKLDERSNEMESVMAELSDADLKTLNRLLDKMRKSY